MIDAWMYSVILLGALIGLGGTFLAHLSPRLGVPRRWLWLALMLVSVVLPVGLALRPARPPAQASGATASVPGVAREPFASPRATEPPSDHDGALLLAWVAASLLLAGIFTLSHRRIRRELAACPRRQLGGAAVAVSRDFGPAAVGLLRPDVVLPEWVFGLPTDEQELVLRHELEHIRAGDHLVLLAGVTLAVLMPWNLGLWWQLRRLRVGMEVDCDARVAPALRDRPRYAELLLRARSQRKVHRLALALVPAPSALTERLMALLESARLSRRQVVTWSASALACGVVVTRVPVPSVRLFSHGPVQKGPLATLPPLLAVPPTIPAAPRSAAEHTLHKRLTRVVVDTPPAATRMDEAKRTNDTMPVMTRPSPRYDVLQPVEPGMLSAPMARGGRVGQLVVAKRTVPDSVPARNQ